MKSGILLCLLLCAGALPAAGAVRSVTTVGFHRYSYGAFSTTWEEAGILKVSSRASFLCGMFADDREGWRNRIVKAGVVAGFGRSSYAEATYGYGVDSDGLRTDYYALEATRETARSIASIGYKYTAAPVDPFSLLSPSLRYGLTEKLYMYGKLFFSYDASSRWNYVYVAQAEYFFLPRWSVVAGGTGGDLLLTSELDRRSSGAFRSVLGGISFKMNDTVSARYLWEGLRREKLYDDVSNTLVLDVRF